MFTLPTFLDKTIVKITLALAILTLLVGTYQWHHDTIYQAGVDHQISVQAKVNEEAEKVYTKKLTEAIEQKLAEEKKAAKLQQDINKIERKYREISKIAANAKCDSLGPDTFTWWNSVLEKPGE